MKMTQADFLRDPSAAYALVDERRESLTITDAEGKPRIILHYHAAPEPCRCAPEDRMWICVACDGHVGSQHRSDPRG